MKKGGCSVRRARDRDVEDEARGQGAADEVEPGMVVKATEGDLGEKDLSKPKVSDVVRDDAGDVESVVVEKGLVFRKHIEVPADRVERVKPPHAPGTREGKVTIAASEREIEALSAGGSEQLVEAPDDVLEEVEETIPTAEGLRRKEARGARLPPGRRAAIEREEAAPDWGLSPRDLGPGFLSGMAGNDASAVTAYSVTGATTGYGQLWLMLIATPLLQAVVYACAVVGRITQRGFGELLREHYGRRVSLPASIILVVANIGLIAGDLVAIGSGIELLTGIAWEWFVAPVAAVLWYLTVYQNFATIKRIFIAMSLAFVAYFVTGILAHPDWGAALASTFIPRIPLDFAGVTSAVALLGATISPYVMYWQMQGEKEEVRPGGRRQQLRAAALDIGSGAVSGNLVAYFIIVSAAATLHTHHKSIQTAADAASALAPFAGPFARYLFAVGLIGAGVVAIPVLLASTSYGLSGTLGWRASLWKKPWQTEGFYLILTAALAVSLALALLRFDPIRLMFGANVLQGLLAPVLIVFLILVANNRRIMKGRRIGRLTNIGLILTAILMGAATALFFVGLFTGQGG